MHHSDRPSAAQAAILFVSEGSPGWQELAQALARHLPVALADRLPAALARLLPDTPGAVPALLADDQALPALAAWLAQDPDARAVVIAGEPALSLADSLGDSAESCLGDWRSRAQNVLRLAHSQPARCVFIDVEEAGRHPAEAVFGLRAWLAGEALEPVPAHSSATAAPPLGRWLARRAIASSPQTALLAEEICASSLPLTTPASEPPDPAALDLLAGWRSLRRDTADLRARLAQLEQEREQLLSTALAREEAVGRITQQLAATQQSHDVLAREVADLRSRLADASQRMASLLAEREQVVSQDYQLRNEIDRLRDGSAHLQRDSATLGTQLAQERALREQAHADLQQLQTELDRLQSAMRRHGDAQALVLQRDEELAQWRVALARSESGRESALAQLYDAREAAASALEQVDRYRSMPPRRPKLVLHTDLRLLGTRNDTPHREARFLLSQVQGPTGLWPSFEARLVEHHGQAGLVLFGTANGGILGRWQADGEEDGRPFMLLLPGSPEQVPRLLKMGCSDWRFIQALIDQLGSSLPDDEPMAGDWARIATRLTRQLQALPARLRYDQLEVTPVVGEQDGLVLDIRLSPWSHGQRSDAALALRWRVQAGRSTDPRHCTLAWQLPREPGSAPALAGWTVAAGALVDALALPVGAGWSAVERRHGWARLPEPDRVLLLAVLDALQGAVDQLPAGLQSWQGALRSQAQALHRQAREDLRSLAWRALARRWTGQRAG
jgi:hypothetical protein